ncbi:MAG TPA: hypothetical protein VGF36_13650, partial [Rhodopila sp.]
MSWGGGGGFFGPSANPRPRAGSAIMANPRQGASPVVATPVSLGDLRAVARDAYAQGRLADAAAAQSTVLAMARTTGTPAADDFLFAGLIHHADRRIADGIDVLRDGL